MAAKKFASALKRQRKAAGLSTSRLAVICGVSRPCILHWERGGCLPNWKYVQKIVKVTEISYEDLEGA